MADYDFVTDECDYEAVSHQPIVTTGTAVLSKCCEDTNEVNL
jgi:hypothetical protein